ncbi:MAG: lysine--tRNA ligase [Candidatus Omnitrophica bacterium]|nr:lysine--tRNA ligase [Candidatus Omnitrophota bacterium]
MELNEILAQRKEKLNSFEATSGAYPNVDFPDYQDIASVIKEFQEGRKVVLSGRIMAKRVHGKVIFADLRDMSGRIQLYVKADSIGQEKFKGFDNLDIADIIQAKGELFKTHTGEPTVKVEDFRLLAKSLRPLPEKWHGLKDVELRYRQRYLDLIANEEVKKVFLMRARIIKAIRDYLDSRGFIEVETPMMHSIAGGAAGRPFKTFHNEYAMDLYLRIAPELYLKRLIVGGLDRVYEINRSFRNEGVSTRHNPEFTMLEVYQAYANYKDMMRLTEELIVHVTRAVLGKEEFVYQDKAVKLSPPWQERSFADMVKDKFGILPSDDASTMLRKIQDKGFAQDKDKLTRSQVNKIIEDVLEHDIAATPTFVTDYFTNLCPLAKAKRGNPLISERFELYIAGIEIGNAYTELNNPLEQRRRFEEEIKELEPLEQKKVDEDYIIALEHGMPPTGGLGIGIDRLCMLLTNQPSIRDVILFPLLRPEG